MRNQFPSSKECDLCENPHTKQSNDGWDLCDRCWKESVIYCNKCKIPMVGTVAVYTDGKKDFCQLCYE